VGELGYIPLAGQLVVEVMFSQGNFWAELAKGADDLAIGMRKGIFMPFGCE